ncbi:MAG: hypothetical protein ACK4K9_02740 [Bacteroidia bacterium]
MKSIIPFIIMITLAWWVDAKNSNNATYNAKGDYANAGYYLSALPEGTAEIVFWLTIN